MTQAGGSARGSTTALHPIFQIGHILFPAFTVFLTIGIFTAFIVGLVAARSYGLTRGTVLSAMVVGVLAFMIGTALLDMLVRDPLGGHTTARVLVCTLIAVAAVYNLTVIRGISFWQLADGLTPPVTLGLMVTRIGCFFAGCDYGKPTAHVWGATFTSGVALALHRTPLGVPLHPTQLYESGLAAFILLSILALKRCKVKPGVALAVAAIAYSLGRFVIEFFRGDVDRGFLGPLSFPQWLCLVAFIVTAAVGALSDGRNPTGALPPS